MTDRAYRLEPPDRTGWLLGLAGPQVLTLGTTVVLAVIAASGGAPPIALAALCLIGIALSLARLGGQPLLAIVPTLGAWAASGVRGQRHWFAEIPLLPGQTAPLPPCLDGLQLLAVDGSASGWPGRPVAVVRDQGAGTYAATIRAVGGSFALAERVEQERLLDLWGDALGAFCREGGPISSIMWSEFAAPAGMRDHLNWLAERSDGSDPTPAAAAYRQLVEAAGPVGTRHEVLITVAVGADRVRRGRDGPNQQSACIETLLSELRLFSARLDAAGLIVTAPLAPEALGSLLRVRLDPSVSAGFDQPGRSLGELVGLVDPHNVGPLATERAWDHWRVDGSVHRVFYASDWPRLPIGPTWFADLLLAGDATRTVAVRYEPVPPRTSRRAIERAAAKLDSDEEHRHRTGFRVGAAHRRAQSAVADRESELVAGYAEFRYCGLVVVSAVDRTALDRVSAEVVQRAGATGVELRPVHGRHDRAMSACLPLARGLASGLLG